MSESLQPDHTRCTFTLAPPVAFFAVYVHTPECNTPRLESRSFSFRALPSLHVAISQSRVVPLFGGPILRIRVNLWGIAHFQAATHSPHLELSHMQASNEVKGRSGRASYESNLDDGPVLIHFKSTQIEKTLRSPLATAFDLGSTSS